MESPIIPVIDILDGTVVHARRGERDRYLPLTSILGCAPRPGAVLRAYLSLYPFPAFYIADLNAIQGQGDNLALVAGLVREFPGLSVWLDAGRAGFASSDAAIQPVIGTETGISAGEMAAITRSPRSSILSLDFSGTRFLGHPDMLSAPDRWPERLIILDLAGVGAGHGPPLQLAGSIIPPERLPAHRIFLGGGVRNPADLEKILHAGFSGALVATAIHSGALSGTAIAEIMQKKTPAEAGVRCGLDNPTGL